MKHLNRKAFLFLYSERNTGLPPERIKEIISSNVFLFLILEDRYTNGNQIASSLRSLKLSETAIFLCFGQNMTKDMLWKTFWFLGLLLIGFKRDICFFVLSPILSLFNNLNPLQNKIAFDN